MLIFLAEKQAEINRPIEDVYNYVINMENFGEWFPNVIEMTSNNTLAHGEIGKKYTEQTKLPFNIKKSIPITVIESTHNSKFVTDGDFPPLMERMTVTFSAKTIGSTLVTWKMESRNHSRLANVFFMPIAKIIIKNRAEKGMLKLKQELEKPS